MPHLSYRAFAPLLFTVGLFAAETPPPQVSTKSTTGFVTNQFFGEKFEYDWIDGEYVCISHPDRKIDATRFAEESLAYVDGAYIPTARDIFTRATLTHRRGKMDGDYAATDFDLRLTRRLGEGIAVVGELGLTDVDMDRVPRLADCDRFGVRRIGVGLKTCFRDPKPNAWAISATGIVGTSHLDPVSGLPSLGLFGRGMLNCEYRLGERVTYFANPGYEVIFGRHTLTTGQNDKTPYVKPEITHGLAVRLTGPWYVGVENRVETHFVDIERFDASALYLGPSLHYAADHASVTLAFMPQLAGRPNDPGKLDLTAHERTEIRLRVAFAF